MSIKTIFLDRDGVINKDIGYLYKINDFLFNDSIFEICSHFEKLGYQIIIVTNQSGIFRNLYSEADYKKLNNWMLHHFRKNNINILSTFHCPHGPESTCNCRKPKPGMLIDAKKKYNIVMKDSWIIGDKESDIIAGLAAGIENTILFDEFKSTVSSKAKFIIHSLNKVREIITF